MAARRLVRLIHPKHYSEELSRFKSPAFKDTDGSGISVVDERCVEALQSLLCEHIRTYYPSSIAGEPPIFWRFDDIAVLPAGFDIEQQDSESGDRCHNNIKGVKDGQARQIIQKVTVDQLEICDGTGIRQLTLADIRLQIKN